MKNKYTYVGKKATIEYSIDYGLEEYSYDSSLVDLHPDIKWKSVWSGDYQGDVWSVGLGDDGNWYYKNNSYGSCSECDWIQGMDDENDAIEFFKNQESIDCIGKDKDNVKEYLKKEIENSYDFNQEEYDKLIAFVDSDALEATGDEEGKE